MTTNKQAFKKAFIKELSVNYNLCFKRYGDNSLTNNEYDKLVRYLKPLYCIEENDYVCMKYYSDRKLLKLMEV